MSAREHDTAYNSLSEQYTSALFNSLSTNLDNKFTFIFTL